MDHLEKRAEKAEEAGDLQAALGLWKAAAAKEPDAVFFCRYAEVAEELGLWDEAEQAFSQALRLEPNLVMAMEAMGNLWASRTDKQKIESLMLAKDWFLRALSLERSARLFTFLGATYRALEELDEARVAFEQAITIDSNYEEALYNLGVLDEKADPQRSRELLERAVQIDPDYLMAHQTLGKLYQRANDLTQAEYHFRRCLEIDPADYWSNIYIANLLGAQGKHAEAEQTYRFATTLHPEMAGGLALFAGFLESIGKSKDAARLLRKPKKG